MKVLVLGQGSREHALTWMFSKSKCICGLFIAPGNAGTDELGTNLPDTDPDDPVSVVEACRNHKIDLVFVGSERPLEKGVVDRLNSEGIAAIGPHKNAAQLETSKIFSKQFMQRYGIPSARSVEFAAGDIASFENYIRSKPYRVVIKKNGLAAGKGVLESENIEELGNFGKAILKNDSLLVEEYLSGYEISVFALSDGNHHIILPSASDFKKAHDGDKGPNTGGMGAICPVTWVDAPLMERIKKEIIEPTYDGMKKEGLQYKGVLYFGLMITKEGPKVLEYNVRFGDPEAQVLLPTIESDFGDLTESLVEGDIDTFPLNLSHKFTVGVVVASQGYPGEYKKGIAVHPIPNFPEKDALVFHASTYRGKDGHLYTGGGRCFTVVGFGKTLVTANLHAYEAVEKIQFEGAWYRRDIGKKFFID